MGDDHAGSSQEQLPSCLIESLFKARVEVGGGFIQDQQRRVFQKSACQGETLALPAAQPRASFADHGFVARGQVPDEFMCLGCFRRLDHFAFGSLRTRQANISFNRVIEQIRILRYPGQRAAPRIRGEGAQVLLIHQDATAGWVFETKQ